MKTAYELLAEIKKVKEEITVTKDVNFEELFFKHVENLILTQLKQQYDDTKNITFAHLFVGEYFNNGILEYIRNKLVEKNYNVIISGNENDIEGTSLKVSLPKD